MKVHPLLLACFVTLAAFAAPPTHTPAAEPSPAPHPPGSFRSETDLTLRFPPVPPGDPEVRVSPQAKEAARLTLFGEPNQVFELRMPEEGTTTVAIGGGDTFDRRVLVREVFASRQDALTFPPQGKLPISLGALTSPLRITQMVGGYVGAVPVTVLYP